VKALIIILALVGLSFVGLLIYGEGRNQDPKRPCQRLPDDGKVPDNWCPPSIAKATRPLQIKFGPGLDLPKPGKAEREVNPQQGAVFDVPAVADPEKHRMAKLTLLSGDWAIVHGPDDAKQCLCKPKQPLPAQLQGDACGANWQEDHAKTGGVCQPADKHGTIPIEWMGGQLVFDKGPAARVEIK
jgi:hypothetical protein